MQAISQEKRRLREVVGDALRTYMTDSGRQAAKNLSALLVFRLLSQTALLVTVLILTHVLSKPEFGWFMVVLTLQRYMLILSGSSTTLVAVRDISQDPSCKDAVFSSYITITGTGSLAVFVLIVALSFVLPLSAAERGLLCLIALGNVFAALDLQPFYDVRHEQAKWGAFTFAADLAALVAILVAWQFNAISLTLAGIILAARWGLGTTIQHVWLRFFADGVRFQWSWATTRSIVRSAWPLAIHQLVANAPLTSGVFFVRIFHGNAATGSYGLATQIAAAFLTFAVLAHRIVQPHAAGPHGLESSFFRKLLAFYLLFFSALWTAAVGCTAVVAIGFLPEAYRDTLPLAVMLLVGTYLFGFSGVAGIYLVVLRREIDVLRSSFMTTVVYLAVALWLIPRYAATGAVAGAVGASGLLLLLFVLCVIRGLKRHRQSLPQDSISV